MKFKRQVTIQITLLFISFNFSKEKKIEMEMDNSFLALFF